MATVSLSPTPAPLGSMSSRRLPLSSNPNIANSPLRGAAARGYATKQKRSYANTQREEIYGCPPPPKKLLLDNCVARNVRSPTKIATISTQARQRIPPRATSTAEDASAKFATGAKEHVARESVTTSANQVMRADYNIDEEKEIWRKHYRARFPNMVFYFDNVPDDVRARLTKKVAYFGARQEAFFSIAVTHVVTTRLIPAERGAVTNVAAATARSEVENHKSEEMKRQPQTINPSMINRGPAARRKLLFEPRPTPLQSNLIDESVKLLKPRNNDVLHKAREMGKKIWSLEKFQNMLSVLLEAEGDHSNHATHPNTSRSLGGNPKGAPEPNLLQLLHNERINGPSDRDLTVATKELVHFKGPFIYVWDMDEKQKPMIVREYPKVAQKSDGEWPQFRSVPNGRCPFVEEADDSKKEQRRHRDREREREKEREREREREKVRAAAVNAAAAATEENKETSVRTPLQASTMNSLAGKRTHSEMEASQSRNWHKSFENVLNPAKAALSKQAIFPSQNAFVSRAGGGRLFAGEPVASGMQPSGITSAIRSQMISSTSGLHGAKAGTSTEVHRLQRNVLQKKQLARKDPGLRRLTEISVVHGATQSASIGHQPSRTVQIYEDEPHPTLEIREKGHRSQSLKSKKDAKAGFCENCQDRFEDFDEHIVSRKHRKFAENDGNWTELDLLLRQLRRLPKYGHVGGVVSFSS